MDDIDGPLLDLLVKAEITWIHPKRHENATPVPRKHGLHRALFKDGRITPAQHLWAERYAQEMEILTGARLGTPALEVIDCSGEQPIIDRRTQAAGWLRLAHGRLNRRQRILMEAAVVQCYRVCDVAVMVGIMLHDDETMEKFKHRVKDRIKRYLIIAIEDGSGIISRK